LEKEPLLWKGVFDGVELVAVKGNIVDIVRKYRPILLSILIQGLKIFLKIT
jgi:hypothetical protein